MAETGQTIAHFELGERLGSGGFATVFRARDLRLGRPVAVKILRPQLAADAGFVARFQAEAKAEAGIRHPHIVTLYEAGMTDDGIPYLVMELLEGRTLSQILQREGPLPAGDLTNLVEQLASALDYLHARRIVHRDIKPANVIVDADGQATLMDLGIARSLDAASLTLPGQALGTPIYMSPEQITGKPVGPSADRYALGILCYELLTGKPPFLGTTSEIMRAQVLQPVPPVRSRNPIVPITVAEVVERMLAKRPEDRYDSAGAFAQALVDATQGLGERSTIIRPPSRKESQAAASPAGLRPVRVDRRPAPSLRPVIVPSRGADTAPGRPAGPAVPSVPALAPAPAPAAAPARGMHTTWIAVGLLVLIALLTVAAVVLALVRDNEKKAGSSALAPVAIVRRDLGIYVDLSARTPAGANYPDPHIFGSAVSGARS